MKLLEYKNQINNLSQRTLCFLERDNVVRLIFASTKDDTIADKVEKLTS